jgi:hypothetical protein
MNHIARLTQERDHAREVIRALRDQLTDLEVYLTSTKFQENDSVHVRTDILPKVGALRFLTCGE